MGGAAKQEGRRRRQQRCEGWTYGCVGEDESDDGGGEEGEIEEGPATETWRRDDDGEWRERAAGAEMTVKCEQSERSRPIQKLH